MDENEKELKQAAEQELGAAEQPPARVMALVEEREEARSRRDWAKADLLRARMEALGWHVRDTPHGPRVIPLG